jgi:DNA-binding response OmpR family regulator
VVDPARREARLGHRALDLSRKEFDLLHALARRRGKVASRRELLAEVWDQPLGGPDKTLDVHLSWLRQEMGESGTAPRYLHTVRGVGIRLIDPEA